MLTEVMEHFGLRQELHAAGFYETEHHRQIIKDIRATVGGGRLIAVTGILGSARRCCYAACKRNSTAMVRSWFPSRCP
jgi:type II secretory pathway predicted ATPase ExeA